MQNADELQKMTQEQLGSIYDALGSGAFQQVRRILKSLQAVEIAHLLELLPLSQTYPLEHAARRQRGRGAARALR